MGRFEKTIITKEGVDKRELGYYSTPKQIANFLTEAMLEINPDGERVLDPAVGKEELLEKFYREGKKIDSFDITDYGNYTFSHFTQQDFLEFYREKKNLLIFNQHINLPYDYYIVNPPYNCHETDYIRDHKKELKAIFPKIGVLNMYSMFLSALIDSAKEGALIGVIIHDSFLTAKMHAELRNQIIDFCSIHYIILCPTNLFWEQKADVRTCLLILQKGKKYQKTVHVLNRQDNKEQLFLSLEQREFNTISLQNVILGNGQNHHEFIIGCPEEIIELFSYPAVGEIFHCVTGISTGNDSKYLSKERQDGFTTPFYKNPGSRKFHTEPDAYLIDNFLEISHSVRNFMVRNKPFLFMEGITCSSMGLPFSACYMPVGGTFGVNANIFCPTEDLFWLLSYLNSSLITYIVRGVLIRSNMVTSGYISRIPLIDFPSNVKTKLTNISKDCVKRKISTSEILEAIRLIDEIIFDYLKFPQKVRKDIYYFSQNLLNKV